MTIEEIKEKVESKNIKLKATISENEIVAFETKHNILLPKEYRDFLLEIGNGGEGPPYYGLLSLGKSFADKFHKETWGDLIHINKQFPFTESWIWEDDVQESKDFEDKIESACFGSILLGTDGCGMDWLLIVTGKSRGEIWQICGEAINHCEPRMNFAEWYNYWLEKGGEYTFG